MPGSGQLHGLPDEHPGPSDSSDSPPPPSHPENRVMVTPTLWAVLGRNGEKHGQPHSSPQPTMASWPLRARVSGARLFH